LSVEIGVERGEKGLQMVRDGSIELPSGSDRVAHMGVVKHSDSVSWRSLRTLTVIDIAHCPLILHLCALYYTEETLPRAT